MQPELRQLQEVNKFRTSHPTRLLISINPRLLGLFFFYSVGGVTGLNGEHYHQTALMQTLISEYLQII